MCSSWRNGSNSYRPDELFDADGALLPEIAALAPTGHRRMSANPHANGGLVLRTLDLPRFTDYAVALPAPGCLRAEATRVLGSFLRDVMKNAQGAANFRLFGPDETASNRLDAVYEVSAKAWMEPVGGRRREPGGGWPGHGDSQRTRV